MGGGKKKGGGTEVWEGKGLSEELEVKVGKWGDGQQEGREVVGAEKGGEGVAPPINFYWQ